MVMMLGVEREVGPGEPKLSDDLYNSLLQQARSPDVSSSFVRLVDDPYQIRKQVFFLFFLFFFRVWSGSKMRGERGE